MKLLLIKAMWETHLYTPFMRSLAGALSEIGHEVTISDQEPYVDRTNNSAPAKYLALELETTRYDAVISISSFFGAVDLGDGRSLFDALGVKFVGWQLDHPIYTPQSLARVVQNRYSIYSNRNHLRYAEALKLPGRGTTMLPGAALPEEAPKDFKSREWPLFIVATYRGEPQRLWEQTADSSGKRLLKGVIDELMGDREASLIDAFNRTSAKLRLGAEFGKDAEFDAMIGDFLREPLTYVRNLDRLRIIRALVEAGLPVTLCGTGWSSYFGQRKNVTYLENVEFTQLPTLYNNSQVVLNLNAGNGGSERAIYAAMAGAAVVSDYGAQLDNFFGGGDGIAFFNRAKPATAAHVAGGLIESDRGEKMARKGYDRAVAGGLWRHRASELVDFISGA
jgi:hypothetical protein